MKIEEAIEELERIDHGFRDGFSPEEDDALKLGIEAMKYIRGSRGKPKGHVPNLLRGETP